MTDTFKIGDKVTVLGQHQATITYGPVLSTFDSYEMYVAKDGAGRERSYQTMDLKAAPSFAVGDKVMHSGHRAEIIGGPVTGYFSGETMYLYRYTDGPHAGKGSGGSEKCFSPQPADEPVKVGDRVRVLKEGNRSAAVKVGDVFTVEHVGDSTVTVTPGSGIRGCWYLDPDAVEKVTEPAANTYTHAGIVYDLTAKYEDNEGDTWEFNGSYGANGEPAMELLADRDVKEPLSSVVRTYGPLDRL